MPPSRKEMYAEIMQLRSQNIFYKKILDKMCCVFQALNANDEGEYEARNEYHNAEGFYKMGFAADELAQLTKEFMLQLAHGQNTESDRHLTTMPHKKHKNATTFVSSFPLKLKNKNEIYILAYWWHLPNTKGDALYPLMSCLFPLYGDISKNILAKAVVDEYRMQMRNTLFDIASKKELQVIKLTAEGHTSESAAKILNIKKSSVTQYKRRIRDKTGLANYMEVVCRYLANVE